MEGVTFQETGQPLDLSGLWPIASKKLMASVLQPQGNKFCNNLSELGIRFFSPVKAQDKSNLVDTLICRLVGP